MRRAAMIVGLGCAVSALGGCSLKELIQPQPKTLPNGIALDKALSISSLTEGEQPFHLILGIFPPAHSGANSTAQDPVEAGMTAQVELFWLNRITYRTVIHSKAFSQIRIVNGRVVEEHNTGDFYPRWIQNFVDALLEPVPKADLLRGIPGSVPVGVTFHACIATPASSETPALATEGQSQTQNQDPQSIARVCFRDTEPRIASGMDFTRYVAFDDFAAFGHQQIARTLVNVLPANLMLRGQITRLEPLSRSDYHLLRATEFTLPAKQIQTALVSRIAAESLLITQPSPLPGARRGNPAATASIPSIIYIRTDRTGRVREAYRNSIDHFHQQDAAVARALTLKFKPLILDGVARQMEAPFELPGLRTPLAWLMSFARRPSDLP